MDENIVVLGLDEQNHRSLMESYGAHGCRFHGLLSKQQLQHGEVDFDQLVDDATRQLEAFDEPIDAIIGYWDFPISSMLPILCAHFGLRSADLASVVTCEHKYWSRLEQAKVVDEYPRFGIVDSDSDTTLPDGMRYPAWLKPVKSFSSDLAFKVNDDAEFAPATRQIRDGIDRIGGPFEAVLARLELPDKVAEAGGRACLAEEAADGTQFTVEGYSRDGEVTVYGAIDSVLYPGSASFLRYQYPSTLPERVLDQAADVARRVIKQIGLDWVAFNIEFIVDPDTDRLTILEINPRHSQSHAELFLAVDGTPNHQATLRLALGRDPELTHRQGDYACAAKWFLRHFSDAWVHGVPGDADIERVHAEMPGTIVNIVAAEGTRLSDEPEQDSYSYELANIILGADSETELATKYQRCLRMLPFDLREEEPCGR